MFLFCVLYLMLPVSLDGLFFIAPSVSSNVYLTLFSNLVPQCVYILSKVKRLEFKSFKSIWEQENQRTSTGNFSLYIKCMVFMTMTTKSPINIFNLTNHSQDNNQHAYYNVTYLTGAISKALNLSGHLSSPLICNLQ